MPRILLTLAVIGIAVYALTDLARTERDETGGLPKALWAVLIVLVPAIGAVAWIVFRRAAQSADHGRPVGRRPADPSRGPGVPRGGPGLRYPGAGRGAANRRAPAGPDDDPEFLRRLGEDLRRDADPRGRRRGSDPQDPDTRASEPEDSGEPQA